MYLIYVGQCYFIDTTWFAVNFTNIFCYFNLAPLTLTELHLVAHICVGERGQQWIS